MGPLPFLLVGLGLWLAARPNKSPQQASAPGPVRPAGSCAPVYRVIGDSYAVGVKSALKKLCPYSSIIGDPKVGQSSFTMPAADDIDVITIVSAGTNDAAGGSTNADAVLRVLGPYARGEARMGHLYYVVPHTMMDEPIRSRVQKLLDALLPRLQENERFHLIRTPAPTAPDHTHFGPKGYEEIARQAL